MKYCLLLFALLFSLSFAQAQSTASSCEGSDSLKNFYHFDATKLALRELYNNNNTDTASILVDYVHTDEIMKALVAVHQAYGLAARDEVIDFYNIHALKGALTNSFTLHADTSRTWVQRWLNAEVHTGNSHIDCRIDSFELFFPQSPELVYDAINDVTFLKVTLQAPQHLNMAPLLREFLGIDGILAASENRFQGEEEKNIEYVLNSSENYAELTYSYGWENCESGCANEHFWIFRVDLFDCSVTFRSDGGSPLKTNNPTQISQIAVYPNPTRDQIVSVKLAGPANANFFYRLHDSFGRVIDYKDLGFHNGLLNLQVDLSPMPIGVYFITFSQGDQVLTERIVKR